MQCGIHGIESVSNCGWCGNRICDECIKENRKRYCASCVEKLSKVRRGVVQERTTEISDVRNVDRSLSDSVIEEKKKELGLIRKGTDTRIQNQ
ncbi:hypothetical protein CMO92_02990 [Candidatus Woesearchaeota archaeon]|nr:hypothetical protein [Candidatus Woesearchaeota archaeon]